MKRLASIAILACWAAVVTPTAAQDSPLTQTGLFPVYDSSGDPAGEDLAAYLTPAIYESFKDMGRELVLLNPGGGYSLLDEPAALDYARTAGVQVALMPSFAPTERTSARDNEPKLRAQMKVLDVASGAIVHAFSLTQPVKRKDLDRGFDRGPGFHPFMGIFTKYSDKSRKVEKQELGKVLMTIADAMRTNVLGFKQGALISSSPASPRAAASAASCNVEFSIRYTRQRSNSKSYELFVNDRDESNSVTNEGTVALMLKPGLSMLTWKIKDPPYRLPAQRAYTINRWMNCSPDERRLVVEIGPVGEALAVSRP